MGQGRGCGAGRARGPGAASDLVQAWQEGLPLLDERRLAVEPCLAQPVVHCELVVRARDREQAVGCRGVRCVRGRHSDGRPPGDSGVVVLVLGGGGRRAARTDSHRRETTLGQEPAQNATVIGWPRLQDPAGEQGDVLAVRWVDDQECAVVVPPGSRSSTGVCHRVPTARRRPAWRLRGGPPGGSSFRRRTRRRGHGRPRAPTGGSPGRAGSSPTQPRRDLSDQHTGAVGPG